MQAITYVHGVNELIFKIYRECWTIFIAYQANKTPLKAFIMFIFHVRKFWRGEKIRKLQLMPL